MNSINESINHSINGRPKKKIKGLWKFDKKEISTMHELLDRYNHRGLPFVTERFLDYYPERSSKRDSVRNKLNEIKIKTAKPAPILCPTACPPLTKKDKIRKSSHSSNVQTAVPPVEPLDNAPKTQQKSASKTNNKKCGASMKKEMDDSSNDEDIDIQFKPKKTVKNTNKQKLQKKKALSNKIKNDDSGHIRSHGLTSTATSTEKRILCERERTERRGNGRGILRGRERGRGRARGKRKTVSTESMNSTLKGIRRRGRGRGRGRGNPSNSIGAEEYDDIILRQRYSNYIITDRELAKERARCNVYNAAPKSINRIKILYIQNDEQ